MRAWPILIVLWALASAKGISVEVPVRVYESRRAAIEVSSIRGYVADPTWARIPKAKLISQKRKGTKFIDVENVESSRIGEFDFVKSSAGVDRLIVRAPGFCEVVIPIKISRSGWPGLEISLPVSVSDTPAGYCDEKLKIERLEK